MPSELEAFASSHIRESIRVKDLLLGHAAEIASISQALGVAYTNGGTIYTCGNGGSSCDAMHFCQELVARFRRVRPGVRAAHFGDISTVTCWGNDVSYETVFARQAETFVTKKDVLMVFSTSGHSPNILRALEVARTKGALTIGLLGSGGGEAKSLCDLSVVVDSQFSAHIQECHITIIHILCGYLEDLAERSTVSTS
jgi:D-sedoheptulose 7-phosphate isomerase